LNSQNGLKYSLIGYTQMLRIINWNISYLGKPDRKIEFLNGMVNQVDYPCLVALEEVTGSAYEAICEANIFQDHLYSLILRPQGRFESKNRGLGCFIGTTGEIKITDSSLIDRAPFPERALTAKVKTSRSQFDIICFHSLTGVHFKKAKSAHFAALADYLNLKRGEPLILCCDLNEPKFDYLDPDKMEFFDQKGDKGKYARLILQPGIAHDLQDVYRVNLYKTNPGLFENQKNPDILIPDQHAASHIFRGGIKKRYDYIMASTHWSVKDVRYLYDEAILHGSDHALLLADLE